MKIFFVIGTRPELIKMAPVIYEAKKNTAIEVIICLTGQQTNLLEQVAQNFGIVAQYNFRIMKENQTLVDITSNIISCLNKIFLKSRPDIVVVHGDTSTSFAAALAAFYHKIKVAHVEAGLRTGDKYSPWPEEMNRLLTARIADLHFAPTESAKNNLVNEGILDKSIYITGNTVVDSISLASKTIDENIKFRQSLDSKFGFLNKGKRLLLVTSHRRENFGDGIDNICNAIMRLSEVNDLEVIFPCHPNPNILNVVQTKLSNIKNVWIVEPFDYFEFVYLMKKAYLILTDSGGVQEEAPALGTPVLVMRDSTERPEGLLAGVSRLVGSSPIIIYDAVQELMHRDDLYNVMAKICYPFGNTGASKNIIDILIKRIF